MNGLVNHLPRECYPIQWGEYCILEEETMYLQGGKTALRQGGLWSLVLITWKNRFVCAQRKIPDFVTNKDVRWLIELELFQQRMVCLCSDQMIDHIRCGCEECFDASLALRHRQCTWPESSCRLPGLPISMMSFFCLINSRDIRFRIRVFCFILEIVTTGQRTGQNHQIKTSHCNEKTNQYPLRVPAKKSDSYKSSENVFVHFSPIFDNCRTVSIQSDQN